MEKTAMQIVINKMKDAKENLPPFGFDEEFLRGFNKAFQMAIFIADQIGVETEKKQIINANNAGYKAHRHKLDQNAEDYYNETFKQQ